MITHKDSLKRWKEIVVLRRKRFSLREIGTVYGLSGERVRQILLRGEPRTYKRKAPVTLKEGRERTRELVRMRDKYTCQDCELKKTPEMLTKMNEGVIGLKGLRKSLDVHHLHGLCGIKSRGYDKMEDMDGLITLCHKCHYNRPEHKTQSKEWSKTVKNNWKKHKLTKK